MDIDEGEIEFKNIKDYIEDQGYMFKDLGEGSTVANFEKVWIITMMMMMYTKTSEL